MPFWIINLFLFQVSWLMASVYHDQATMYLLILVLIHFVVSPSQKQDCYFLIIALVGWSVDQTLLVLGILTGNGIIPSYLVVLWIILAVSFNHSLHWLTRLSPFIVALIGAVSGSLSYYGALNLGAINTRLTEISFISAYAFVWAFLLPLFVFISKKIKQTKWSKQ